MKKRIIQKKKTKYYFDIILTICIMILLVVIQAVPVFAEQKKQAVTDVKELILKQNEAFPDLENGTELDKLFMSLGVSESKENEHYRYVDAQGNEQKPTSETVGFQQVYIETTDNTDPNNRIVVPVTVTNENTSFVLDNQVAIQLDGKNGQIILYPEETANKSAEELQQLVEKKANARAWNTLNGSEVQVTVNNTTISNRSVGKYTAEFQLSTNKELIATVKKDIIVFGAILQKPVILNQNQDFNLEESLKKVFSTVQSVKSSKASDIQYQVVDENGISKDFDTSQIGFQWGYVKLTDKGDKSIATIVKVPVSVIEKPEAKNKAKSKKVISNLGLESSSFALENKIGVNFDTPLTLTESDVKDKSEEQVIQELNQKIAVKAWDIASGDSVKPEIMSIKKADTKIDARDIEFAFPYENKKLKYTARAIVYPDGVFEEDSRDNWLTADASNPGTLVNGFNGSMLGFSNFGDTKITELMGSNVKKPEIGLLFRDSQKKSYIWNGYAYPPLISQIPSVNFKPLYDNQAIGSEYPLPFNEGKWNRFAGLGWDGNENTAKPTKVLENLRKENKIKQIILDDVNNVLYVYNGGFTRNLNFNYTLDMYNISNIDKTFTMLESVDLYFNKSDGVPVYALRDGSGFKMEKDGETLSIKLKDNQGRWLSGYKKWNVYDMNSPLSTKYGMNYFGDSFAERKGQEALDLKEGDWIFGIDTEHPGRYDSSYELGAPAKLVSPMERLRVGYELFYGSEIPKMKLETQFTAPKIGSNIDMYTSQYSEYYRQGNFQLNMAYTLGDIPDIGGGGKGTLYVTYPNGTVSEQPFEANVNENKTAGIILNVPNKGFVDPSELNPEKMDSTKFTISSIAVDETFQNLGKLGQPSNDAYSEMTVYNFAAIPKFVQKKLGTAFSWGSNPKEYIERLNKLPSTPENKITYEYVDKENLPDTTKDGIFKVPVKITDTAENVETIIPIPFIVYTDAPPTSGLDVVASDIRANPSEIQGKSMKELKEWILDKSNAVGVDRTTGSIEGVDVNVNSLNGFSASSLPGNYKVGLIATKGSTKSAEKMINITITKPSLTTTVQFVEKGKESTPIATTTFSGAEDSEISDLTKETGIKSKLAELSKQYEVSGATDTQGKEITSYPKYTIGSTENNTIRLILNKKKQKLTVQFKTTDKEDLDPSVKPIVIEETIGTEIELSKNKQVIKVLNAIKAEHYQLVDQPEDKLTISESPQTVTYTFDGKLFIESAPSTMSFGEQKIQKGIHFIKVNNAEFDKPLVIWDSRKKSKNWKVTATLQTPFTNVRDSAQTLPDDVLGYKKDNDSIVKFRQGDAEILAERTSEGIKNEYTLSEDWKSGKTGFRIEIPTNEIVTAGGYMAKILWQVANTP
ncbi:hypothetical protein [Enterococcus sp. AZ126]|uniref:hypothetical protein n=1 Tax=Enterococcus sp. AZ126 TaxID=2774635 RepID=UPI003F221D20